MQNELHAKFRSLRGVSECSTLTLPAQFKVIQRVVVLKPEGFNHKKFLSRCCTQLIDTSWTGGMKYEKEFNVKTFACR